MKEDVLERIRLLIQADVGGRGLAKDPLDNLVTATTGDFASACRTLAESQQPTLAIVTGFFIPHGQPPCGETDGPLGALFLARALVPLGIRVLLATDAFCIPALQAGLAACGLRKAVPLLTLPPPGHSASQSPADYWQAFADKAGPLTHLLALERVGPSHTPDSVEETSRALFLGEVPAEHHDRYHTMKGRDITVHMSPAHFLFQSNARRYAGIVTLGIGDGGNEIGMGKVPWEVIRKNIPGGTRVACRTATDHLIVCGISNWGAYGLATGVRLLRGADPMPELFDLEQERQLLQTMIDRGPLVDGVSGEPTATVDGLPFERYAEPLRRLAELLESE